MCDEEYEYEGISAFDGDDWEEPSDEELREFFERMEDSGNAPSALIEKKPMGPFEELDDVVRKLGIW